MLDQQIQRTIGSKHIFGVGFRRKTEKNYPTQLFGLISAFMVYEQYTKIAKKTLAFFSFLSKVLKIYFLAIFPYFQFNLSTN